MMCSLLWSRPVATAGLAAKLWRRRSSRRPRRKQRSEQHASNSSLLGFCSSWRSRRRFLVGLKTDARTQQGTPPLQPDPKQTVNEGKLSRKKQRQTVNERKLSRKKQKPSESAGKRKSNKLLLKQPERVHSSPGTMLSPQKET